MSYNIGQLRSSQMIQSDYFSTISIEELKYEKDNNDEDANFVNQTGLIPEAVNNQNSYYLCFYVSKLNSQQDFYLKLKNSETNQEQIIQQYSLKKKASLNEDPIAFEVVFTPNSTYDQIIWELKRTAEDYSISNPDIGDGTGASIGRKIQVKNIETNDFRKLTNLIKSKIGATIPYLTKIGIQGSPGLLMCINGEQIRIGRSGIYEINNNINITSISFVPKEKDIFIMDYEY